MNDRDDFQTKYQDTRHLIETHLPDRQCRVKASEILDADILQLLALLNDRNVKTLFPNVLLGELSLCATAWTGYSVAGRKHLPLDVPSVPTYITEAIQDMGLGPECAFVQADFIATNITDTYGAIVAVPPIDHRYANIRGCVAYIEKCLDLLALEGQLIALVPTLLAIDPDAQELRSRILRDYSLEAVIPVQHVYGSSSREYTILIIHHSLQTPYIYMTLGGGDACQIYENYKNHANGYMVAAEDIYDRIDAQYYDPQYQETRELIQKRNTIKLGELATLHDARFYPKAQHNTSGDFYIVQPQNIYDRQVHLEDEGVLRCSREDVLGAYEQMSLLKSGDVVVSTVDGITWGIYSGKDYGAVASSPLVIIRAHKDAREWLELFFHTNTGIEYLESQLRLYSHGRVRQWLGARAEHLVEMAIPDIKMMRAAEQIMSGPDLEARTAALFRSLGWDVRHNDDPNNRYDLALYSRNELRGVVEVKSYSAEYLMHDKRIASRLASYRTSIRNARVYLFVDDQIYEYIEGSLNQLAELPRPEVNTLWQESAPRNTGAFSIESKGIADRSMADSFLIEVARKLDILTANVNEVKDDVKYVKSAVDDIKDMLQELSRQIAGYQSLIDRQLELADSSEEKEHILHAFSEECTERIVREVDAKRAEQEYAVERQKLIYSFGESAWNKMHESSQTFLVSAKVIFNNLISIQDIVDYSGVCLLVTKALEVEMKRRFCIDFLNYLEAKYPGENHYQQYPTGLRKKNGHSYGQPIHPDKFTMGSIAWVLCYSRHGLSNAERTNNKTQLLEYCRDRLFSGESDDDIMNALLEYAQDIERVREDYRNPSAHSNELRRLQAQECFDLVLDVEKLMKRMLDSFDY